MAINDDVWDVSVALRDISLEILNHVRAGAAPESDELKRWLDWLGKAERTHNALAVACEDLVELGVTDDRIESMKQALTSAQGQTGYWSRADRW